MHKEKIEELIKNLVGGEYASLVEVFTTTNVEFGDFSTNVAMKLASKLKQNPITIAQDLKERLSSRKISFLEKITVVNPGYLNFYLDKQVFLANLERVLSEGKEYGQNKSLAKQKIMVEFAHPNPFKVMHIGHLRNITLGESLVRLHEAEGAKVIRTNYQGDVGMHVAKCVWALKKIPESDFPKTTNERVALLGKCYVLGAKAYDEDEAAKKEIVAINKKIYQKTDREITELWRTGVLWSLDKFHEIYARVYSHFDREYMESETLPYVDKEINLALEKGILKKSEGALIFDGSEYKIDTRVYLNSEGLPTYEGKQLGLVVPMEMKDFGKLDKLVFNVAVEQISFFKSTIKVIELMYPEYAGIQYHNAYEFVGLKSGKMSSRKGDVVTAETILNEAHEKVKEVIKKNGISLSEEDVDIIAVGAVKYAYLKMSPFKYLAFDLEASVSFSGDSGPYLQYTYARAKSILRKAEKQKDEEKKEAKEIGEEILILKKLFQFPEIVTVARSKYCPNYIATYLNEVAQLFNTFYSQQPIMGNVFRLKITQAVAQVIQNGLYLLGIKTLETM